MLFSGAGREDVHHWERQSSPGVQTGCDLSLQRPRGPQEHLPRVQVFVCLCDWQCLVNTVTRWPGYELFIWEGFLVSFLPRRLMSSTISNWRDESFMLGWWQSLYELLRDTEAILHQTWGIWSVDGLWPYRLCFVYSMMEGLVNSMHSSFRICKNYISIRNTVLF